MSWLVGGPKLVGRPIQAPRPSPPAVDRGSGELQVLSRATEHAAGDKSRNEVRADWKTVLASSETLIIPSATITWMQ